MLWKKIFTLIFIIIAPWLSDINNELTLNNNLNQLDSSSVIIVTTSTEQKKTISRPNFENLEETFQINPLNNDSYAFSPKLKSNKEKINRNPSLFTKDYWKREKLRWMTKLKLNPKKITEIVETGEAENYFDIEFKNLNDKASLKKKDDEFYRQWYSEIKRQRGGIKPENLESESQLFSYESDLAQYYKFSWQNVSKYGLTFKEIENTLIIIAFIRFCIYTIKYDVKTAFIICGIGLISAHIYLVPLSDCISIGYGRLFTNTALFRFMFEEYLERIIDFKVRNLPPPIQMTLGGKLDSFMVSFCPSWILNKLYKSEIYWSTVEFITESLIPDTKKYLITMKNEFKSLLVYSIVLRMGKRFVPYHIQWHVMFYVLYGTIGHYYWQSFINSQEFLQYVLIPEQRYEEIELMKLLHCFFLGLAVYLSLLAMLHAIFSQYFYIPLFVPNMEAHIGKKPKNDRYAGGYTSWQDELELFRFRRANLKLWFGLLGKGPNDRKRRRRKK